MKLVHQGNARDDDEHTQPRRFCVFDVLVFFMLLMLLLFFRFGVLGNSLADAFYVSDYSLFSLTLSPTLSIQNIYRRYQPKLLKSLT